MPKDELKKCPFCGNDAKVISVGYIHDPSYAVICKNQEYCWASLAPESAWWITKEKAINAWNHRQGGEYGKAE